MSEISPSQTSEPSNSRAPAAGPGRLAAQWIVILILAVLTIYLATLTRYPFYRISQALQFPYQLDGEEGFLLNQTLRISKGEGLYRAIQNPPYLVDNYPPLYPALWSILLDAREPNLKTGRAISAASAVLAALAIMAAVAAARFLKRKGASPPLAAHKADILLHILCGAIAALLFFNSGELLRWVGYARVDLTATALTLVGLVVFIIGRGSVKAQYASILFFMLAFLTKQTAIAAPAACAAWMLLFDRPRARRYVIILAAAFIVPMAMMTIATHGGFWRHTVTYNQNEMHWNELAGWANQVMGLYLPVLVLLVLLCTIFLLTTSLEFARRRKTGMATIDPSEILFVLYAAANLFSVLSLAKAGAAENYLIEPIAAAAVFIAYTLASRANLLFAGQKPVANGLITAAIIILLLANAAGFFILERGILLGAPQPNVTAYFEGEQVLKEIKARPGIILSEDPIYTILAGRRVLFQNFIMTQLTKEGTWDETALVERVAHGEVALIVSHSDLMQDEFFDRWSPRMREAIKAKYVLLKQMNRDSPDGGRLPPDFLYVPRR